MNCTATTRLTAEECLARLDACPALPRGERLAWACESPSLWNRAMRHRSQWYGSMLRPVLWSFAVTAGSTVSQEALDVCWARWRTLAAPVRRLREERRALRLELSRVGTLYGRLQRELAKAMDHIAEMEGHPKDDGGVVP